MKMMFDVGDDDNDNDIVGSKNDWNERTNDETLP